MDNSEEKVTVKVAAKALNVSDKTIYRYIEKGQLSKIKKGRRVYVPMSEIRTLRNGQGEKMSRQVLDTREKKMSKVSITKNEYESLLVELGELRERNKLLLEHKLNRDQALTAKDEEVAELKQKLQKAETEIAQLKKPLFRRIVEQVIKK